MDSTTVPQKVQLDIVSDRTALLPGSLIKQAAAQLHRLGDQFNADRFRLQELSSRLAENRFHLAVLGQFKRGKSTLLNALIGEPLLPASVVPLTAVPTFIFHDSMLKIRIIHPKGIDPEIFTATQSDELTKVLFRFVTESGNPNNKLNVASAELYYPADLLRHGVVLIDTPGIGSTFRHNTEVTLNFLSQCDAAFFVMSADPPLTEVEVEFLKEVSRKVSHIFFILNKVDYLNSAERQSVLSFLKKVLKEQVGIEDPEPIFSISARLGLEARQTNDLQLWQKSGMAALEKHLIDFSVSDKANVLKTAVANKAADSLQGVLMRLELTMRSLQLPLKDLDERRLLFEQKLVETEQQRLITQDLLAGDHKRILVLLEDQAEQLRRRAIKQFNQVVESTLASAIKKTSVDDMVQTALSEAIPSFFERELGDMSRTFEHRVSEILEPYRQRADALVESIQRGAAEIFEVTYKPLNGSNSFTFDRKPSWVTHRWRTKISPFEFHFIGRLLPMTIRRKQMLLRLHDQIEAVVIHNVESLRWTTIQNLNQTVSRFKRNLDERLKETGIAAKGAIQAAIKQRQEHAETIDDTIYKIKTASNELKQLHNKLKTL